MYVEKKIKYFSPDHFSTYFYKCDFIKHELVFSVWKKKKKSPKHSSKSNIWNIFAHQIEMGI